MQQDGPKRFGRFLKKGSKVLDKVLLEEFTFKEINPALTITHDNVDRTIIHSKFHDPAELDESVKAPDTFDDDLGTSMQQRLIIFPMDFTKDWERDKKLRKDRVARADDDDFDYESVIAQQRADDEARAAEEAAAEAREKGDVAPSGATPGAVSAESGTPPAARPATTAAAAAAPASESNSAQDRSRYASIDVVGNAIKSLVGPETGGFTPLTAQPPVATPLAANAAAGAATQPPAPPAAQPVDLEAQAMQAYRQQQEAQKAHEERMTKELEEAKAQGYRDGFRIGEEKADLQVRRGAADMFGKVKELIEEFAALKHTILDNVQENFYELCQAMAEALIKREFSIHPETFVTVLRRAIAETVDHGSFKIKVHPDTYERVLSLGEQDITGSMVKDSDVEPGDFRIESNMSVVDVNVSKMIRELLQQADLGLFEQDKSAHDQKLEKAG